jgi:hypothetical protein
MRRRLAGMGFKSHQSFGYRLPQRTARVEAGLLGPDRVVAISPRHGWVACSSC